jgi:hypothetical protein
MYRKFDVTGNLLFAPYFFFFRKLKLATTTLVEENRQSQIKSREGAKSIGKHELRLV